jgi:hypothetical protein
MVNATDRDAKLCKRWHGIPQLEEKVSANTVDSQV